MDQETTLPTDGPIVEAGEQLNVDLPIPESTEAKPEAAPESEPEKKEKTAEQREIDRLRRRVDNLTRQKYELRANQPQQPQNQTNPANDDEPVTLTRAEVQRMVAEQAQQLAPTIMEQRAEIERRQGIVSTLAKTWGQEEFDAKAADLDDAFGGLADAQGRPKPATDAIFDANDPQAVIEYLTDPDHADEAARIARLPASRAIREIDRIELKMKEDAAKAKPKPSNAPKPLEAVKGGGLPKGMPDPSNTKAYIAWANAQERSGS